MAKRKTVRKSRKKAAAKRTAPKRARRSAKPARKAAARKPGPSKTARKAAARKPGPPKTRHGVITHTELASTDPGATKLWCEQVLGWTFGQAVPTPAGPYHMWRFDAIATGGGIRAYNPPEAPGSVPYCEVRDIRATYAAALAAGATEMVPPMQLPGGMGSIAVVVIPGGVAMGFWSAA